MILAPIPANCKMVRTTRRVIRNVCGESVSRRHGGHVRLPSLHRRRNGDDRGEGASGRKAAALELLTAAELPSRRLFALMSEATPADCGSRQFTRTSSRLVPILCQPGCDSG